jgi:mercuric ion transport protein
MNTERMPPAAPSMGALALLFSLSTLLCCALPLLLVGLGLGGAVAAMTSSMPWLVTLSQYKHGMFLLSAAALAVAGWTIYRPGRRCPADPALAQACRRTDRWSRGLWLLAIMIWCVAAFVAYAWLPLQIAWAGDLG